MKNRAKESLMAAAGLVAGALIVATLTGLFVDDWRWGLVPYAVAAVLFLLHLISLRKAQTLPDAPSSSPPGA